MRVTIKDIAKKAGVSVAAVSKALNDQPDIGQKTKDRIKRISKEMGYTPNAVARNLVKRDYKTLGILIPDISTPIYPAIYKGISASAIKYGYTLLLGDMNRNLDNEKQYAQTMMENRVAGLIVSPICNDTSHLEEVVRGQIPIVYFGGKVNHKMKYYVGINNVLGASLATEHLISQGHKNILMISDKNETKTRLDRIHGYVSVMEKNKLEPKVRICSTGSLGRECGSEEMLKIIDEGSELPTAIFALNDSMAIGIMEVLMNHRIRIPEDVAIMGYDDIPFSSLPMINLSTVWQPKYETGEAVIKLINEVLTSSAEIEQKSVILDPHLCLRNSTAL
ncbi:MULTISPECIES: LacI family DNA-binding transcriptional regulator [unclassified Oceanispirochaeta]|uniref:LacI family DNA-binding transcriptional regulator n=1 Tax=unclassified Oceanispirochaeta TaxID=2635722 RepID=UPI000E09B3F6|nr:LacI family DNA-binding transcriptional regulator [Oceanispirochaeta sp. M1]MBF9017592.1 LacI family DNA-binding transcriptional regulator [Oceanispirochaeta sp. M2]NPD74164.1 LacI family transcriptional regulator [Oceanispirochaeta sp. M1]RDG29978.1 LacI family transcriptional regulator [Oceanispirochaeta sp. M1]